MGVGVEMGGSDHVGPGKKEPGQRRGHWSMGPTWVSWVEILAWRGGGVKEMGKVSCATWNR
jgi:hypothetical protein